MEQELFDAMETYKISAFARIAGVTVRTLQHYDRTGILKPAGRTESGYRFYTLSDLFRLQQIRTLKWMGFSLKEASQLLDGAAYDLVESLTFQKEAIKKRAEELSEAASILAKMIDTLREKKDAVFEAGEMSAVLKAVESDYWRSWMKKFVTEEQWARMRGGEDREVQRATWETIWNMFHEAFVAKLKPEDPAVQQAVGKMRALASELASDLSELRPSFRAMAEDYSERKDSLPPFMKINPEMQDFIVQAMRHYHQNQ